MSGGEILRAVLDQSCTFSAPNFYTLDARLAAGVTAATMRLEAKTDRMFLVTAISSSPVNPTLVEGTSPVAFNIVLPRSSRRLLDIPLPPRLLSNGSANNVFTLPEYILIDSNETIVVELTRPAGAAEIYFYITLHGIEYGK